MSRARDLSRLANSQAISVDTSNNVGVGSTTPDAKFDVVGVVSATEYYGDGSNLTGIVAGATLSNSSGTQRVVVTSQTSGSMTAAATDSDLTYNASTNTLSATTFSGNATGLAAGATGSDLTLSGVLTYEDVANVDSVGLITARSGIEVSGIVTAKSGAAVTYYGDGSGLTGLSSWNQFDTWLYS